VLNNNHSLTPINTCYIGDSVDKQNGMKFTTKDEDNDEYSLSNCATECHGAWWYKSCHDSNSNRKYLGGSHTSFADGIEWRAWRGFYYSLKSTKMMIRRQ